jgi:hypothetical protein
MGTHLVARSEKKTVNVRGTDPLLGATLIGGNLHGEFIVVITRPHAQSQSNLLQIVYTTDTGGTSVFLCQDGKADDPK